MHIYNKRVVEVEITPSGRATAPLIGVTSAARVPDSLRHLSDALGDRVVRGCGVPASAARLYFSVTQRVLGRFAKL